MMTMNLMEEASDKGLKMMAGLLDLLIMFGDLLKPMMDGVLLDLLMTIKIDMPLLMQAILTTGVRLQTLTILVVVMVAGESLLASIPTLLVVVGVNLRTQISLVTLVAGVNLPKTSLTLKGLKENLQITTLVVQVAGVSLQTATTTLAVVAGETTTLIQAGENYYWLLHN